MYMYKLLKIMKSYFISEKLYSGCNWVEHCDQKLWYIKKYNCYSNKEEEQMLDVITMGTR